MEQAPFSNVTARWQNKKASYTVNAIGDAAMGELDWSSRRPPPPRTGVTGARCCCCCCCCCYPLLLPPSLEVMVHPPL